MGIYLKATDIVQMGGQLRQKRQELVELMEAEHLAYERVDEVHALQTILFHEIALIEKILELNPNDEVKVLRLSADKELAYGDDNE